MTLHATHQTGHLAPKKSSTMPRLLLLFEHGKDGGRRGGAWWNSLSGLGHLEQEKHHWNITWKFVRGKNAKALKSVPKQNKYNKKGQQKQCACFDRHPLLNCPVFLNVGGEGPQTSDPRNTNAPFLVYVSAMDKKADGREREPLDRPHGLGAWKRMEVAGWDASRV